MNHTEDDAWTEYREKFAEVYDESNYANSDSLQARAMRASHRLVEKPFGTDRHFSRVLEIGAGTGEHFPFVRHSFDQYVISDMDPKTLEVARRKLDADSDPRISIECQRGEKLNCGPQSFDRIVAVHVLEHIYQPHLAIKDWIAALKPGGVLSILIPTDPGFAWRLGRHVGPRKNAVAMGIAYDYVMAREHVNSCVNLIALLKHYLPEHQSAWWPLPVPSVDVNLFYAFNAQIK